MKYQTYQKFIFVLFVSKMLWMYLITEEKSIKQE